MTQPRGSRGADEQQRRRIRRTTFVLALVAIAIYVWYIASAMVKSQ